MDLEVIYHQFDKLEEKIDTLIGICKSLKIDKTELQSKIDNLEQELERKIEAEKRQIIQRETIQGKIDSLLIKLDALSENHPDKMK